MKVFISSTYKDLIDYRAATIRAVEGTNYQASKMEVFGVRPDEPLDACLKEVEESDLFIGIYAHRYGYVPAGSAISITEMEYVHAKRLGKPIYIFIIDEENQPWLLKFMEGEPGKSKLKDFKKRVQKDHVCDYFTTPDDLRAKVANALSRFVVTIRRQDEQKKALVAGTVPASPIWRGRNFVINDTLCFVLMPFREEFQEIYEKVIKVVASEMEMTAIHGGEIFSNREIMEDVWDSICQAKLIIADVTQRNPNVFYELGICHTLGKDTIVITQNKDDVPFDIQGRRYLLYDPGNQASLRSDLRKIFKYVLNKK